MSKQKKNKLKGKFVIVFDTVMDGHQAVTDEKNNPTLFNSYDEAFVEIFDGAHSMLSNRSTAELKEYNKGVTKKLVKEMGKILDSGDVEAMKKFLTANENCNDNNEFVQPATEFIQGRKVIFGAEGAKITGKKLK